MNNTGRTNAAGEELRIDANICARIYDDGTFAQGSFQKAALCTISVSLENTITREVDCKRVVVNLVANCADKRN